MSQANQNAGSPADLTTTQESPVLPNDPDPNAITFSEPSDSNVTALGPQNLIQDGTDKREYEWEDGIKTRFCLLIYGEGHSQDETDIFMEDCKVLEKALTAFHAEESKSHVLPATIAEERFLELMALREDQIAEKLLPSLKKIFPDCNASKEGNQLVHDLWIHVRLLKAVKSTLELWSDRYPGVENLDCNNCYPIFEALLKRWKLASEKEKARQRTQKLTTQKRLACLASEKNLEPSQKEFLDTVKKCRRKLKLPSTKECLNIVELADDIFSASLYLSGIPVHVNELGMDDCAKFFSDIFKTIAGMLKMSSDYDKLGSADRETVNKKFLELVECLSNWKKIVIKEQWMWIHYSGHGRCRLYQNESLKNLNDMIKLSCELCTYVVVSLDCCHSGYSLPSLSSSGLCLIIPSPQYAKSYLRGHSEFTYRLCFALRGLYFKQCYFSDVLTSSDVTFEYCGCQKPLSYNLRVSEYELSDAANMDVQKNFVSCFYCATLWTQRSERGFIFLGHVDQYLKSHLRKYKLEPSATCVEQNNAQIPLLKRVL